MKKLLAMQKTIAIMVIKGSNRFAGHLSEYLTTIQGESVIVLCL